MALLRFMGGEVGEIASGVEWGNRVGTVTVGTSNVRSGNHALSIAAASSYVGSSFGAARSTTYFIQTCIFVPSNPTLQIGINGVGTGGGVAPTLGETYLETNGTVTLRLAGSTALQTSAALPTGQYSVIELSVAYPASTAATLTLRVNGTVIGTGTGSATLFGGIVAGNHKANAPGATFVYDDLICNDSTGTSNNNFPGGAKIVALWPQSDSSITGFTAGAGGTTNLFAAVNGHPPNAVAVGSATNTSQIKDTVSNTTDNYVATMGAYTDSLATGGGAMGANDTVIAAYSAAMIGGSSTTARTAGLTMTNPTQAEQTGTTPAAIAGTYPSNWTDIAETTIGMPTVTLGTKPTLKFRKGTASTDAMMAAAIFMMVAFQPALNVSVSDSISHTESPGVAVSPPVLAVNVSDTIGSSDAPTVQVAAAPGALAVAVSDTIGSSDTPALSIPINVVASDTINSSDTVVIALIVSVSVSDTIGSSDTATAVVSAAPAALSIAVSDSAHVADTPTVTISTPAALSASVSDSIGHSEAPVVAPLLLALGVSDTIGSADTPTVALGAAPAGPNASASDTVGSSDTPTVSVGAPPADLNASASDTITSAEAATVIAAASGVPNVTVSDSVTVADAPSVTISAAPGALSVSVSDSVGTADSASASLSVPPTLSPSVSDAVGHSEAPSVSLIVNIGVSDTVSTSEAQALAVIVQIAVTQSVSALEAPTVEPSGVPLGISVSDAVSVSATPSAALGILSVSVADTVGSGESQAVSPSAPATPAIAVADAAHVTESINAFEPSFGVIPLVLTQGVSVGESIGAKCPSPVSFRDTIGHSEHVVVSVSTPAGITLSLTQSVSHTEVRTLAPSVPATRSINVLDRVLWADGWHAALVPVAMRSVTVSDTVVHSETIHLSPPTLGVSVRDQAHVGEALGHTVTQPTALTPSAHETISHSESTNVTRSAPTGLSRAVSDATQAHESVHAGLTSFLVRSDSASVSESVTVHLITDCFVSTVDSVSVADTATIYPVAQSYRPIKGTASMQPDSATVTVNQPTGAASTTAPRGTPTLKAPSGVASTDGEDDNATVIHE